MYNNELYRDRCPKGTTWRLAKLAALTQRIALNEPQCFEVLMRALAGTEEVAIREILLVCSLLANKRLRNII